MLLRLGGKDWNNTAVSGWSVPNLLGGNFQVGGLCMPCRPPLRPPLLSHRPCTQTATTVSSLLAAPLPHSHTLFKHRPYPGQHPMPYKHRLAERIPSVSPSSSTPNPSTITVPFTLFSNSACTLFTYYLSHSCPTQTISVTEKFYNATSGTGGGYEADGVTPNALMQTSLQFIDDSFGKFYAAVLKAVSGGAAKP